MPLNPMKRMTSSLSSHDLPLHPNKIPLAPLKSIKALIGTEDFRARHRDKAGVT